MHLRVPAEVALKRPHARVVVPAHRAVVHLAVLLFLAATIVVVVLVLHLAAEPLALVASHHAPVHVLVVALVMFRVIALC